MSDGWIQAGAATFWRRGIPRVGTSHPPQEAVLLVTATLVGFSAGLGAVVFRLLISGVTRLSFDWLPAVTRDWGTAYLILAPVLGGLLVGPLIQFFAPEARGHGVPEVMEAVALHRGRIRPIVAVIKSLASSICIGSGGSVGREGPIVQIGSALGSTMGQALHLSTNRVRNLVACGAAGGIAATFNAPIAGALFALEIILGDFSAHAFGTVVIASVTASVVGRMSFGDVPAFPIPEYTLNSMEELPLYVLLGVFAAVAATILTRIIYWTDDLFVAWTRPPAWTKPALGGLLLGTMAWLYGQVPGMGFGAVPQIYGVGYRAIESALHENLAVVVMLGILLLKIAATGLTLGSGGSGGVFAPSLFLGAMLGGSFGVMVRDLVPGVAGSPGAYALVGMGAVFAGAARAPLTATIIMFEMTGDYKIILPLMLAVGTSTWLSRSMLKGATIYTLKLLRRGVRLQAGLSTDVLQHVRVDDVMTRDTVTVRRHTPVNDLPGLFLETNRHAFPVLEDDGRLCGIISLSDLRKANGAGTPPDQLLTRVEQIMTDIVITAYPDETLDVVLARMGPRDLSRMPVVSRDDRVALVGVVRRNDIVKAYNLALRRRASREG